MKVIQSPFSQAMMHLFSFFSILPIYTGSMEEKQGKEHPGYVKGHVDNQVYQDAAERLAEDRGGRRGVVAPGEAMYHGQ